MKRKLILLSFLFAQCLSFVASAQTVRLNATVQHQHITGFGGFVCSPQFGYNHMSTSDIKKVWGQGSTVGCNIMRLYIPIGRNAWNQSLLSPFDCYAAPASQSDFFPFDLSLTGIQQLSTALPGEAARFDLQGRRIGSGAKGLHIVRSTDGKVRKVVF